MRFVVLTMLALALVLPVQVTWAQPATGADGEGAVSYTHLTLPTIYSV